MANAETVVGYARRQIGKPYVFNTPLTKSNDNPPTFDCSGLTMMAYHQIGKDLAHYTGTQYAQLEKRPYSQAQPGDLVFYADAVSIYHVGIYVGGGRMIHAPQPGDVVKEGDCWPDGRMSQVGIMPGGSTGGSGVGGGIGAGISGGSATSAATGGMATSSPNAPNSGKSVPNPPFDPATLKAPLGVVTRATMEGWIKAVETASGSRGTMSYKGVSDSQFLVYYTSYYNKFKAGTLELDGQDEVTTRVFFTGILEPLNGVLEIFYKLTSPALWRRVGLIMLGGTIVLIVVILAFRS